MKPIIKVLIADSSLQAINELTRWLLLAKENFSFSVQNVKIPTKVIPMIKSYKPEVLILEAYFPQINDTYTFRDKAHKNKCKNPKIKNAYNDNVDLTKRLDARNSPSEEEIICEQEYKQKFVGVFDILPKIDALKCNTQVIILTGHREGSTSLILEAMGWNIVAFLDKSTLTEKELLSTIIYACKK